MKQYILAAEADKIQDFVFRSSRLREVVGGSQLLSRFCEEVPFLIKPEGSVIDIVISAGGSFRILFDDKNKAKLFGEHLAEVYRSAMDSSLTVAEPQAVNGDFGNAIEKAEKELRKAKRWRDGWQSQEHMPYIIFCSSCGVGLAVDYGAYNEGPDMQYLCAACLNKNAERRSPKNAEEAGSFLRDFYRVVLKQLQKPEDLTKACWPGKKKYNGRSEIDPTEDIADFDPRRYVAYLLADGNRMGEIFGECRNSDQIKKLSKGLTNSIRQALAAPTKEIIENNNFDDIFEDRNEFIPALPLILGGDDLFALIPAPWALDFAQCFCQVYELEMDKLVRDLDLNVPRPTISAAVVICKSSHPYRLAHEVGMARLNEAKQIGKRAILIDDEHYSTVNFEVVLGGRLVTDYPSGDMRPTLRPYWVMNEEVSDWGLSINSLIDQRFKLRAIPNRRLSEIQSLYDLSNIPKKHEDKYIDPWQETLEKLISRIKQRNKIQGDAIDTVLKLLGGNTEEYWFKIDSDEDTTWYGHGLPDLLEIWDFALKLKEDRKIYQEDR